MISQTAEYALRAALCLAREPDDRWTMQEIARSTLVPPDYLAKVLKALTRAGIAHSQRGRLGGYVLAEDRAKVSVLTVLEAVEPLRRIHECPLGLPEHKRELCSMHKKLDEQMAHTQATFRDTTLASLLEEPGPRWPLGRPTRARQGPPAARKPDDPAAKAPST